MTLIKNIEVGKGRTVRVSVTDGGKVMLDGFVAPLLLSYEEADDLAEAVDKALDEAVVIKGRE